MRLLLEERRIVMASHGYTGFKQWLMGSVAENVAQHASVPVLILRDGAILHTHLPLIAPQRSVRWSRWIFQPIHKTPSSP
jgi:universal stress protein family protein